ncbi:hypothetical protein ER308_00320 [Egibacter rhizosphaerae]|uniref:Uncharacterized protein n=1 Tax=Egibacter rhizosphaerae TaxID=1670831 RepID=A0A411YAG0_9ACTN|nr:hypothetical protein [Egibacter rhizosphaerae]QBI18168.1 hypothetical protein ER308_00320 [Egibacter rhizosphaerae]
MDVPPRARDAFGDASHTCDPEDESGSGAHDDPRESPSGDRRCPLCTALDAWEAAAPEVRAHLRAAGQEFARAVIAAVEHAGASSSAGDHDPAAASPPHGEDAGEAASPGPTGWARPPGRPRGGGSGAAEPAEASRDAGDRPRLRRVELDESG